jgi:hypothetical protein
MSPSSAATPTPPAVGQLSESEAKELRDRVKTDAAAAIEKHRSSLRKGCWDETAKQHPEAKQSNFVWNITFDAAGKQVARGIVEEREHAVPGVSACISDALPVLEVPAPGKSVMVEVPFSLP